MKFNGKIWKINNKITIDRRNKDIRFANIQISNNGKLNVEGEKSE